MESPNNQKSATVYPILFAISISHLLNDMMQSVIPSIYPLLKANYHLSFTQIGLITLSFQMTASLLQPFVGIYTDKNPQPKSLAFGMTLSLLGIISIAFANNFISILLSVALVGMGSSVFHPESSRVAQVASGGKKGLAQSIFQVGGNAGSAIGPLLAALIIIPFGQKSAALFGIFALIGITILLQVGKWYGKNLQMRKKKELSSLQNPFSRSVTIRSLIILLILIFSKYFYTASIQSYFTFYLMEKFQVSMQESQIYLFIFLASVAIGTILGGPIGDKYGRKLVIWVSILGVTPFTLLLPYVDLTTTIILVIIIGLIISSAFSAILVFATDLLPGKVGMIAGLFFGLAFGMGGLGSAVLGYIADLTSIEYVYKLVSFLPILGIAAAFLPKTRHLN